MAAGLAMPYSGVLASRAAGLAGAQSAFRGSAPKPQGRVFLGMPGYGDMTAHAHKGVMLACRDPNRMRFKYEPGSLLANNFNQLWCDALNAQAAGAPIRYFAMQHADIGPQDWWLDALIDELEAGDFDALGVVAPIKDGNGLTSIAVGRDDGNRWQVRQRLTMREIFALPETFTSDDVKGPLLLNTGLWVCRFDPAWNSKVYFTIRDRIVKENGKYVPQNESEDWFFSRLLHEIGRGPTANFRPLRIGCTRKIRLRHRGHADYGTDFPWGEWEHDRAFFPAEPEQTNPAEAVSPALASLEV